MIYRSPFPDVELPDLPLTTYVLAGAGPCAQRLNCEVVQGYGMTELSPASR
jgi:hypothetical protein